MGFWVDDVALGVVERFGLARRGLGFWRFRSFVSGVDEVAPLRVSSAFSRRGS